MVADFTMIAKNKLSLTISTDLIGFLALIPLWFCQKRKTNRKKVDIQPNYSYRFLFSSVLETVLNKGGIFRVFVFHPIFSPHTFWVFECQRFLQ